jgi:hypothetical protein
MEKQELIQYLDELAEHSKNLETRIAEIEDEMEIANENGAMHLIGQFQSELDQEKKELAGATAEVLAVEENLRKVEEERAAAEEAERLA